MIHDNSNFLLNQISTMPLNTNCCDDNFIGNITYNGTNFEGYAGSSSFGLMRNAKISKTKSYNRHFINYYLFAPPSSNRKIVILLESPHVNEFTPESHVTVTSGPALGNSGNNFNKNCIVVFNNNLLVLTKELNLSNAKEVFDVYFVNAIRYQCSLGQSLKSKKIRDFVFEALWNYRPNSFKDDLIERLNIIQPDLIINACTKGLRQHCCNVSSISPGLLGFNYSFLTASEHIFSWNGGTIFL